MGYIGRGLVLFKFQTTFRFVAREERAGRGDVLLFAFSLTAVDVDVDMRAYLLNGLEKIMRTLALEIAYFLGLVGGASENADWRAGKYVPPIQVIAVARVVPDIEVPASRRPSAPGGP